MTPEYQRIAIHEARGLCPHTETEYYTCQGDSGFTCKKCGKDTYGNRMPDYLNDLNAMREAEPLAPRYAYYKALCLVVVGGPATSVDDWAQIVSATAAQRAEAFLKTIGKWKD